MTTVSRTTKSVADRWVSLTEINIVGSLTVDLRTNDGCVRVELNNINHTLNYNLITLQSMALQGHTYTGGKDGVALQLVGGDTVIFSLIGKPYRQ